MKLKWLQKQYQQQLNLHKVTIIGGGLAGCEAAWQIAQRGISVKLYEMRGVRTTPAHHTSTLAELVCSNSFRSDDITNAVGLLHEEMRYLNSLIMKCAHLNRIPAGSALAVDRNAFASDVENHICNHRYIEVIRKEITSIPSDEIVIIATGPLTSEALSNDIIDKLGGQKHLAFFDAIAPIVYKDSIDFEIAWFQSRYDKGSGKDYINCPLTKNQYYEFIDDLLKSEKTEFKEWEKDTPYFNGCLPIEVMAERGIETLRFGPLKPVGLTSPFMNEKPYAVVQLRQDNSLGNLYNMVGFQTKLKWSVQKEVFNKIPGLRHAEFARLGGLHRNTFINSPKVLDDKMRLKTDSRIRFAGQITGVEGYLESAAIGLITSIFTIKEMFNNYITPLPLTCALGALVNHLTLSANSSTFQPMNINYGLFPTIHGTKKVDRKSAYSKRALGDLKSWISENSI